MSNIHKSHNVTHHVTPRTIGNPLRYITIQIPVIEIPGDTMAKKRKKLLEECDEFLDEIASGPVNNKDALSELLDLFQTMAGYLLCETKETILDCSAAHDYVESFIQHANDRHLAKIKTYALERDWRLIRHEPI